MPTVTTTTTTEVALKPQTKAKLLKELKAYQALAEQRTEIETAIKARKGTIEELLESTGETTLAVDGFKTTLVAPIRKTLNKKKLVLYGVSQAIIDKATDEVPGKSYLKISVPGTPERDDSDD